MTMPNAGPAGWKVTGQGPPTQKVDAAGNVNEGITVAFTTAGGVSSSVFVPWAAYNTDNVRQMIADKAAAIDAVQALNGQP